LKKASPFSGDAFEISHIFPKVKVEHHYDEVLEALDK